MAHSKLLDFRQLSIQNKCLITALIVAAAYCEWLVFVIQPLIWPDLKCPKNETCTKILFIADPQIQGELAAPSPFNHLFIYDSDQYLKSTFSVVTGHFQPDMLVYLGDIMDEGSVASQDQYQHYVKRIKNIFTSYVPLVEVWVPGDNDIGGEMEPIKKDKIKAFESEFQNPYEITSRNISFIKVNAITQTIPKLKDNNTELYKIVVSHYSVTLKYNLRAQVMNQINPNILFCAHSHESKYVKNSKDFSDRKTYSLLLGKEGQHKRTLPCNANVKTCLENDILQVGPNDESLYEIYVPTCSYRMGTSKIGYGAAVFEHKNQILKYTVFWSPQRFPYLFFYLAVLIFVIVYMVGVCAARWYKQRYRLYQSLATGKNSMP